jgi:hypothetical protein
MTRRLLLFLATTWPCLSCGSAQKPAKSDSETDSESDSDSQTTRDAAVLDAVFNDLFTHSHPDSPLGGDHKKLLFSPDELDYSLEDWFARNLPQHLKERGNLSSVQLGLAREAADDLIRRKVVKDAFKGLKPKDNRVDIWDATREAEDQERFQRGSFRAQVFRASAPGYSRNLRFAIIFLTYPDGAHQGMGSYFLARKGGRWVVLDRDLWSTS